MQDIAYVLENRLYLNITNRCTNACGFCIRYMAPKFQGEHNLWLDHEPSVEEIMKAIGDPSKYQEIIFCGYGEPLLRYEIVKEVATKLKAVKTPRGGVSFKIRVDTNGQVNLFYGRNILAELKGLIDIMNVSLNAENAAKYQTLCHSMFGQPAYDAMIEFIKEAKKIIHQVEATVVNIPNQVDLDKVKQLAAEIGVPLRIRPYYEDKYVR